MTPPVAFFGLDELPQTQLRRVLLVLRQGGLWRFIVSPQGWKLPEGPILPGETPEEAALRLLRVQTGLEPESLHPLCCFDKAEPGLLYLAEAGAEADACCFAAPPKPLADPLRLPYYFEWAQWWLSMQSSADELWDVYDENRRLTGRCQRRGQPLATGDYHLVVHVWLQGGDGRLLLTRRAPNKGYPLYWECSGGSALQGDDSLQAALREVREETGLSLEPDRGRLLLTDQREGFICDVWLFRQAFSLDQVKLLPGETCEARLVTLPELCALREAGVLVPYVYFDALLPLLKQEN